MSETFFFADCAAPRANVTTTLRSRTSEDGISYTEHTIAPEEVWREPLKKWLNQVCTINTILRTVDPADVDNNAVTWSEFITDMIEHSPKRNPLADDEDFAAYLAELDEAVETDAAETSTAEIITIKESRNGKFMHVDDDRYNTYTQAVIDEIAKFFLHAATIAFYVYPEQGTLYKGRYVTGGLGFDEGLTDHFKEVAALHYINFFETFPIASIHIDARGEEPTITVTEWVDEEGNVVNRNNPEYVAQH